MNNKGYVYILSNDSMKEGIYKIGLTRRPIEQRLKELGRATGVIGGFKCEYLISTNDCCRLEKLAHNHFAENRIDKGREFFNVELHKIIDFLKKVETEVLLRNQHDITQRLCEINNIDLFMKNLKEDEEDYIEDENIEDEYIENEYINVHIGNKHSKCSGIFNTITKVITLSSGNINMIKNEDLLDYSNNTAKVYKCTMNQQWKLAQNGYISLTGEILKPVDLSVSKSHRVALGTGSGNCWKSWKVEETNNTLEMYKK